MSVKNSYLKKYYSLLPEFVYFYIEDYYNGDSINTQLGYALDIKVFLDYLKNEVFITEKSIEEFTTADINKVKAVDLIRFKSYLKEYSVTTVNKNGKPITRTFTNSAYGINRKLSAVRGLFIFLYKTDQISQNITDKVDFMKLHQKIKKPLTTQETANLMKVLFYGDNFFTGRLLTEYNKRKTRDIALFIAYLGTGVRVSELINLNWQDVDTSSDVYSFVVTRKGGDQQEIFMPIQVKEAFREYKDSLPEELTKPTEPVFVSRNGGRLTVAAVEKLLKGYCHAVGITHPDKTRPHALRRTFACQMIEDGVDIKMVAELLGHKNIEVTHRYYAQYSSQKRVEAMLNHTVYDEPEKQLAESEDEE